MIEGLHIDIGSVELKQHLNERADYHRQKAVAYEEQAVGVQALVEVQQLHQTNDPSRSLASSANDHRGRAAFFQFMADHIVMGETYRLAERDLERIEFASRYL